MTRPPMGHDPRGLERVLSGHPSVLDCAVLPREGKDGLEDLCYLVCARPVSNENVRAYLAKRGVGPGTNGVPSLRVVPVACIPLDSSGLPDVDRLRRVPVIDDHVQESCSRSLGDAAKAESVRVERVSRPPTRGFFHLSDLLPERTAREKDEDQPRVATEGLEEAVQDSVAPAHAAGGPMVMPPGSPNTLFESLERAARLAPDRGVLTIGTAGEIEELYPALCDRALRIGGGLKDRGAIPGSPVILLLREPRSFLGAFWGVVSAGSVPVPVAVPASLKGDAAALEKVAMAWELLERPLVVTDAAIAGGLAESEKGSVPFEVLRVEELEQADPLQAGSKVDGDDVALMMLTSGSTGVPKAVMLTHRNLLSRSAASAQMNGFTEQEVSLNWMPLDHVAGIIYFHLRDVWLSSRQIHVLPDLVLGDPLSWLDLAHRFKATITFAPNFAFGLVNDLETEVGQRRWDLSNLRWVLNGAESIVAATARKFLSLLRLHGLPRDAMVPAWGMSETSSGVIYGRGFTLENSADTDAFVEVGAPIPGFEMRIVTEEGELASEGMVGTLQVSGPTVTQGYFRNPEANASLFTEDGWMDTGDLGFLKAGRLTITGRGKDVIVVNSVNYYSHEIEGVVEELPGITPSYAAACAVRPPGAGTDALAIFFVPDERFSLELADTVRWIRSSVSRRVGLAPEYVIPVGKEDIPKTAIGKIQRTQLKAAFQAGEFAEQTRAIARLVGGRETLPRWFFRPRWVRKARRLPESDSPGTCILVNAEGILGSGVEKVLVERGWTVAPLLPGHGPEELLSALEGGEGGEGPLSIVVLPFSQVATGNVRDIVDSALPFLADLLDLAGAFKSGSVRAKGLSLLVVTRAGKTVGPGECADPAMAGVGPVVRTLVQENPGLAASTVDLDSLPGPGQDMESLSRRLVDELGAVGIDSDVAFRKEHRLVPRISPLCEEDFRPEETVFQDGDLVVVSGGLGGIGQRVSARLLEDTGATFLLLDHAAQDTGRPDSHRVRIESVDVSDEADVARAISEALATTGGRLGAFIHLAGVFEDRLLAHETLESFREGLAAKVSGARVGARIVADNPGARLITFSSVNGRFGGAGAGAYSAANAMMDAISSGVTGTW